MNQPRDDKGSWVPLPPGEKKKRRCLWASDSEYEKIREYLKQFREQEEEK